MDFDLAGDLILHSVIYLKIKIVFAVEGDKIRLPIAEFLLCAAAGDLTCSKKQRDWNPCNVVLLPPFLTEAAILHGELDAGKILKIFSRSIMEWVKEEETTSEAGKDNDNNIFITIKAENAKSAKPGKAKKAAVKTLTTTIDNCNNVLAFLQYVDSKSPRVIADPLSLRADKRARVCFQCWTDVNLPTPPKPATQDHLGLTGVLTNVATRLLTAEDLLPVVSAQCKAEKETKGWDRLPPTAQYVILAESATTRTSIPTSPPPTIHRFLNARNKTALQANCSLTYASNNIYLPTSL